MIFESLEIKTMRIMAAQRAIGELRGILCSCWDDETYKVLKENLEKEIELIKDCTG